MLFVGNSDRDAKAKSHVSKSFMLLCRQALKVTAHVRRGLQLSEQSLRFGRSCLALSSHKPKFSWGMLAVQGQRRLPDRRNPSGIPEDCWISLRLLMIKEADDDHTAMLPLVMQCAFLD